MNVKRDGHIHSPYCPHGTKDSFEMYVEKALEKGLEEITFTEHMPFTSVFLENKDFQDECAMDIKDIDSYIKDVKEIKKKYEGKIKINLGFEVDYIEGLDEEIKEILNKYGDNIEDSILSVHFVKFNGKMEPIDCLEFFESLLNKVGSLEKVYDLYFETLLKSIKADLGVYKPKRIGHPTLIRIFNNKYPIDYKNIELMERVVKEIKNNNYEIDFNTAELRKPYCKEIYPSGEFLNLIKKYNVPVVYGSDSHKSEDVGKDFDKE